MVTINKILSISLHWFIKSTNMLHRKHFQQKVLMINTSFTEWSSSRHIQCDATKNLIYISRQSPVYSVYVLWILFQRESIDVKPWSWGYRIITVIQISIVRHVIIFLYGRCTWHPSLFGHIIMIVHNCNPNASFNMIRFQVPVLCRK